MWDGKLSYNTICIAGSGGNAFNSTTQHAACRGRQISTSSRAVCLHIYTGSSRPGRAVRSPLQNQKLNNNSNNETLT